MMQQCSNESCEEQPMYFISCDNQSFLWCQNDFLNHIETCKDKNHRCNLLKPINRETRSILMYKIGEIIQKAKIIKDKFRFETDKIIKEHKRIIAEHQKIIKEICEVQERIIAEMKNIINQSRSIMREANKPIISKHYFSPLEFILTNPKCESESIMDKIKPPKIEEIKNDQGLWKKVTLKTSIFSYLLNTYSEHVKNQETDCSIVWSKNNRELFTNSFIEHSSRFLFISPQEIMFFGGEQNANQCLVFNIANHQVFIQENLKIGRHSRSCTLFKGYPVVIGGKSNEETLDSVEIFKFNKWKDMPSIKYPRCSAAASSLFDKIYVFGGLGLDNIIEVFYEEQNKWEEISIDISYRISPGMISFCNDNLLIFGGKRDNDFYDDVYKINLDSRKVVKIQPLPLKCCHSCNCYGSDENNTLSGYALNSSEARMMTWEFKEEIIFY